MKIALDAGHGINTAGKRTPDGIREWTLNETVLRGFENEIKEYQGVETLRLDDATGKVNVPLLERTNKANKWKADYVISFHHNAFQSKWGNHGGTEVWYAYNNAKELATVLLNSVVGTLGLRNRGIKQSTYYHIIRESKAISCLVEVGFMDSNTDKAIRDDGTRYEVGVNMAKDFARHYKLVKKTDTPATNKYQRPKGTYKEVGRFTNTTTSNIHMRQFVPNVKGVENGLLAPKAYIDYQDVYWGNGYVWVGNGTTWVPTARLDNSNRVVGEPWGEYTAIPKAVVKPKDKEKQYVQLNKNVEKWGFYKLGVQPIAKNIQNYLSPKKFGGLEYEVLGKPYTNVVTIQTRDFGKVNIWIGTPNAKLIKK